MTANKITIDEPGQAWFKGLGAAAQANETLAEIEEPDFDTRLAFFWLTVGAKLVRDYPSPDAKVQDLYLRGAGLHQPARPKPAFELVIDSFDNAAFHSDGYDPDGDFDADEEAAATVTEVARILASVAAYLRDDRGEQGPLHDINGGTVGRFQLDVDQV